MKNETTRNWLLPKKCWPFPSTTLAISEDFQFLASKRGNQAEKSKAHPHHPPPQRSHKLCLGVQFLLFLGSLQKVSLTLHFDGMISLALFLCGDRLLFWVHKNVEKWPTIHISIEATFAFLRANFLGYSYQGYADDNWYQKRIMNARARAKLFLLMLYSYFYIHVCFDFLMRLFVSSNFLHLFALLFLIC